MSLSKLFIGAAIALGLAQGEVIPFDNTAIEKIFQQKNPALFLFTNDNEACGAAKAAFEELDAAGTDNVILTVSDANDGHGLFDRLGEYLGVDVKNSPKVLFMGDKTDKYNFNGEINKDSLAEFITKVKAGEIEQFLKSAPVPETNDDAVKVVVGSTFKDYVSNSEKEVLVKFYAPWCGHCKNLAPHYEEAAKRLAGNPNVLLVKVDSTENEVAGIDIQGFPTLKFFGKDKSQAPIDYNGDRTADGIINWIKEHTEYEWVDVEAKETTEELWEWLYHYSYLKYLAIIFPS